MAPTNTDLNMNSLESLELSNYRRDTFAAESFLAAAHEPPKERPEREYEPVHWCRFCGDNECMPNAHTCLVCFNGPVEE